MFNIICLICSENLLKSEEIVATACGHTFHRQCLESWIASSRTCPTCRHSVTIQHLIKLFFNFDDQKTNLQLEDILKANDELTKATKEMKEKLTKIELELLETLNKLNEVIAKEKILERQKQLDDMTIAGITGIKNESTKEIIKLNSSINTLKLDLLAEKQLRRMHQTQLHELKPDDDNYNLRSINLETSATNSIFDSTQVPDFSPIKISVDQNPQDTKPYIIPSKIQKSNKEASIKASRLANVKTHRSLWSQSDKKPDGYNFFQVSTTPSQPSTSAVINKNQKRAFGEGLVFNAPIAATKEMSATTNSSFFNFTRDSPTFSLASSSTSSNSFTMSSPLSNYRNRQEASPPPSSLFSGPKISDR